MGEFSQYFYKFSFFLFLDFEGLSKYLDVEYAAIGERDAQDFTACQLLYLLDILQGDDLAVIVLFLAEHDVHIGCVGKRGTEQNGNGKYGLLHHSSPFLDSLSSL